MFILLPGYPHILCGTVEKTEKKSMKCNMMPQRIPESSKMPLMKQVQIWLGFWEIHRVIVSKSAILPTRFSWQVISEIRLFTVFIKQKSKENEWAPKSSLRTMFKNFPGYLHILCGTVEKTEKKVWNAYKMPPPIPESPRMPLKKQVQMWLEFREIHRVKVSKSAIIRTRFSW